MDFYASDKGSDTAAGTDPAAPMSLAAANREDYRGDTLWLMGPLLTGNLDHLGGRVRIRPYLADTVVLNCPGGNALAMTATGELDVAGLVVQGHGQGCGVYTGGLWDVQITLADMKISGFDWQTGNSNGQDGYGVCVGQAHDVRLTDVEIFGCTMGAGGLEQVTGYSLLRCLFHDIPGSQDNLPGLADSGGGLCAASSWNGRFERCKAWNLASQAANMASGLGCIFGGRCEIVMCEVWNIGGGTRNDGSGIGLDGSADCWVHDNLVHDTGTPGIIAGCMDGTDHTGNRITSNTLLNCNQQFPDQDGYLCIYERYPPQESLTVNLRTVVQGNIMAGTPGIGLNVDLPNGSATQLLGNFNNVPGPARGPLSAGDLLLARQHGILHYGKRQVKGWRR